MKPIYYGHICLGSQQKELESGVKNRVSRLIRAEKSVQFVGMYLTWDGFGWDTRETDSPNFFVPADITFS